LGFSFRKRDEKVGPLTNGTSGFDCAAVFLNDLMDDRQPEPRPHTIGAFMFRGKEWVKDMGEIFLRNSTAGIRHFDLHPSTLVEPNHVMSRHG